MRKFVRFVKRIDIERLLLLLSIPTFWGIVIWISIHGCSSNSVKANVHETSSPKEESLPGKEKGNDINMAVLRHWNGFNFADTTLLTPDVAEQHLADYLYYLPSASTETIRTSLNRVIRMAAANQKTYEWFAREFDRYLYEPNSPYRNEELYAMVLEQIIACPQVNDMYKIRPRGQMEDINKNRLGSIANDFIYTLASGKTGKLYDIKSDYTLVFFYNPDCNVCKTMREHIEASPSINRLQEANKLKILTLYSDEDVKLWMDYRKNMPPTWINSYDAAQTIKKENLYIIRAIPTLYLLGKDKQVLLKDCTLEQLEAMIDKPNYLKE